jgi:cell wall-associated NlpC family hydrolase
VTCRRPGAPRAQTPQGGDLRKRQALTFAVVAVAALFASTGATADPSVAAKEAQAQQIIGEINSIDVSLNAAVEAYNTANVRLHKIKGDLRQNAFELKVARATLKRSQAALARRLVSAYKSGEQNSTLAVLLGSSSLDELLNNVETINSTSKQDARIVHDVTAARASIQHHRDQLQSAKTEQQQVVAERAAEQQRIQSQLAERRQLLASVRTEIVRLKQEEARRQAQLAAEARARLAAERAAQAAQTGQAASQPTQSGSAQSTPAATAGVSASPPPSSAAAPPASHGGVVGIAMRYLGVPYVWGGASPRGFDCSGLVMYVFSQIGVSLPHSSYAQYGMGAPVSMSQLQPGDLVFFAGASHVGIYIGGGQFIHAPHTGDVVKISSLSGWYASTFAGGRRI